MQIAPSPPPDWSPRFLCASLKAPVILSDGRVTTCTFDHRGSNAVANIAEHDFDETIERYVTTRYRASEDPLSKPLCSKCYTRLPRWLSSKVPRAGWMKTGVDPEQRSAFETAFDPRDVVMNVELSSKCNLRCIGCAVASPSFRDTRHRPNVDLDTLMAWIAPGAPRIRQLRLYHMGETFLHPRWGEFSSFVKGLDEGISLYTSTNGMPLASGTHADALVDCGFDHVMFSIHGARADTTRQYMGEAFDFDTAIAAARRLRALRDRSGGTKPYLSWKYILFEWNDSDEEIAEAKRLMDDVGFDEVHFLITSQPAPSKRFRQGGEAWTALRDECAALWDRGRDYQATTPMSAIYPSSELRGRAARKRVSEAGGSTLGQSHGQGQRRWGGAREESQDASIETLKANGQLRTIAERLSAKAPDARSLDDWRTLREALQRMGQVDGALEAAEAVIAETGAAATEFDLAALGRCHQARGDHAAARAAFEQALQVREAAGGRAYGEDLWLWLRASLDALGERDAAQTMFRRWTEISYLREPKSRVIYCPIPKNAATALKGLLIANSACRDGFAASDQNAHAFARDRNNGLQLDLHDYLDHPRSFRFVVLRNPFERLVSAYANLFVRPLNWRAVPDAPAHGPVFEAQMRQGLAPDLNRSISFEDFVGHLARTADHDLDYHWRPQVSFFERIDRFDHVADFDDLAPLHEALKGRGWRDPGPGRDNGTDYTAMEARAYHRMLPGALQRLGGIPLPEQFFTPALEAAVRERFAADIALFEDRFGPLASPSERAGPIYLSGGALAQSGASADIASEPARADTRAQPGNRRRTLDIHRRQEAAPLPREPLPGEPPEAGTRLLRATPDGGLTDTLSGSGALSLPDALAAGLRAQARGEHVRVVLAPGTYREPVSLTAPPAIEDGGTLTIEAAQPGTAILSGSDPLTGWARDGVVWRAPAALTGALSAAPDSYGDPYLETPELMRRTEMVFLNGRLLRQVLCEADLEPGTFFADTETESVALLPFDGELAPGDRVEVASRAQLLHLKRPRNLTIRGLAFVHDASGYFIPQTGALQITDGTGVLIEDCDFRWNNNKGLQIDGPGSRDIEIRRSVMSHNGCLGLLASRVEGLHLEGCETSHNNWRGAWAGVFRGSPCGAKIMRSRGVVIRGHRALRNRATGLWLDEDNRDVEIDGALILGNYRGLHVEATAGPVAIRNSQILDNRRAPDPSEFQWRFGSGLVITHAAGVSVTGCVLGGNDTAQIGVRDDRETRRLEDTLTGETAETWSAGLTWEDCTIIAGADGAAVRLPGPDFDAGRLWSSVVAQDNRYLGPSETAEVFLVSHPLAEGPQGEPAPTVEALTFGAWQALTGLDGGSNYHGS